MMINLHGSRWAPASSRNQSHSPHLEGIHNTASGASNSQYNSTPQRHPSPSKRPSNAAGNQALCRYNEHQRFVRLLRRLKWKSHMLLFSHHRALSQSSSTNINGVDWPMDPGEAETMFRVDFFECVGVHVSASYDPRNAGGEDFGREGRVGAMRVARDVETGDALIGDGRMFAGTGGYGHRFHENVLAALDSEHRNPLHEVLGKGMVRGYIGVAKEFRNKWKDVDEVTGGGVGEDLNVLIDRKLKRYEKIMRDLNLDEMLGCILEALEKAKGIRENDLSSAAVSGLHGGVVHQARYELERNMSDEPFEAGPDAMEWD